VAIRHGVQLHPRESERLAREAGASLETAAARFHIARGVDVGGRPASVRLYHGELREIMDPIINTLVCEIFNVLRDMPAIAAAEVIEDCIWLTGGGACMHGMAERIAEFTTLKARLVPDPMHAVVNGAAQMLSATVFA
jgi:rod shape-determining protein MreB